MGNATSFFLTLLMTSPAWAVYKCPEASGRIAIQQAPCVDGTKLDVKPASGPATVPSAPDGKPQTEAERLNSLTAASARERRRRDLQERIVPNASSDIYAHRDACQRTQAALEADQYRYEQNLYGKTHATQRASEMAAAAAQCDTRDRDLRAALGRALEQCKEAGGCAGMAP